MKKAKVMLTAIAVVAVVGAGLAFKSSAFGSKIFYTTDPAKTAACGTTAVGFITLDNSQPELYVGTTATSCPTYTYFSIDAGAN